MLTLIIFLLFIAFIDLYSFFGLRAALFSNKPMLFTLIYGATTLFTIIGVIVMVKEFSNLPTNQSLLLNLIVGLTFSLIVAKLLCTTLFMVEDVLRSFLWLFQSTLNFRMSEFISRSYIWGLLLFSIGSVMILLLNYGVLFGKYHYKVRHQTLVFENLPESFNGFKIAQLSDMHLGTFDNMKKVKKGLQLLQDEHPDIIVLTGDLVNNKATEAVIYIDAMKELTAPFGKFTIMGNHDYGDYGRWKNTNEKRQNQMDLSNIEKQMGFEWLNNRNVPLIKNNDTIYLAGVENWGLPPFPQHGNLNQAMAGLSDKDFVVLLSHDPTHWREEVLKFAHNVALTLSGHTHGMQFGFEIGKYRWSPVKYKYPDWADLHESNKQYLYVNRGFGHIGYPGRVGIRPEITIIELRKLH